MHRSIRSDVRCALARRVIFKPPHERGHRVHRKKTANVKLMGHRSRQRYNAGGESRLPERPVRIACDLGPPSASASTECRRLVRTVPVRGVQYIHGIHTLHTYIRTSDTSSFPHLERELQTPGVQAQVPVRRRELVAGPLVQRGPAAPRKKERREEAREMGGRQGRGREEEGNGRPNRNGVCMGKRLHVLAGNTAKYAAKGGKYRDAG